MKTRRLLLLLLAAAAIAAFFVFDLGRYLSLDALKAKQEALQAYAAAYPLQSAAIFFGIYVGATALSIPGAAILTLAAGAVFGLWRGAADRLVRLHDRRDPGLPGRALPAARLGQRAASATRCEAIDQGIAQDGAFYLFTLRLVPAGALLPDQPADGPDADPALDLLLGQPARHAGRHRWST